MRLKKVPSTLGVIFLACLIGFFIFAFTKYTVPILMYHQVTEEGIAPSLSVSPKNFKEQMHFLVRHKYNAISLREFVEAKNQDTKLPRNTVLITFDDGFEDNYLVAYPVLKEHNLPATIFVVVDFIGTEGYLKYAQIKEMISSGLITIGSHTLSGAYLPGRAETELEREIIVSKRKLQGRLNTKVDFFCYPIGGFTPAIQKLVKYSGYKAACTTNRGIRKTHTNDDIYALKRIKVKNSVPNLWIFWLKLSGRYNLFRSRVEPHK